MSVTLQIYIKVIGSSICVTVVCSFILVWEKIFLNSCLTKY